MPNDWDDDRTDDRYAGIAAYTDAYTDAAINEYDDDHIHHRTMMVYNDADSVDASYDSYNRSGNDRYMQFS